MISKAAVAKKILKKNVAINTKIQFDEEGEVKTDSSVLKLSTEGKQYEKESEGFDLQRAKEVLKAEDAFDKVKERERIRNLHLEQKRKKKEALAKRRKMQTEEVRSD